MIEIHADGVLSCPSTIRLPPGVPFPARGTVLSLGGGDIAIVSPTAMSPEDQDAIEARGRVRKLVAPSRLHHLHLAAARARWPEAELLGAPGLAADRVDLSFDGELGAAPALGGDVGVVFVEGVPSMNEVVLLHRPSRTLVVTDLVFHVRRPESLWTSLLLFVVGARGRLAQSRAVRFLVKDRAALARSVEAILDLDFDRLVVAHGDVVDVGAKDALAGALGWARRSPRSLPAAVAR